MLLGVGQSGDVDVHRLVEVSLCLRFTRKLFLQALYLVHYLAWSRHEQSFLVYQLYIIAPSRHIQVHHNNQLHEMCSIKPVQSLCMEYSTRSHPLLLHLLDILKSLHTYILCFDLTRGNHHPARNIYIFTASTHRWTCHLTLKTCLDRDQQF